MRLSNAIFGENTWGMSLEHMTLATSRLVVGNRRSIKKCGVIKDRILVNVSKVKKVKSIREI